MINEHCRIYKVICIYKCSAILKILKSARRSEVINCNFTRYFFLVIFTSLSVQYVFVMLIEKIYSFKHQSLNIFTSSID